MKKIALTVIATSVITALSAQNVFTYGKNGVSKAEFIRAFNKNPAQTANRKQALKEYLDLYIKFKLKVQAAYDAGFDKDDTQNYELQNFKKQLADNIINGEANIKGLVSEAFARSQKELHIRQVFVEVQANVDTVAAYKKIQAAFTELKSGKSFADVAAEYSTDEQTKQAKGDLGYITAFSLPYNIENVVYSLRPDTYSEIVRTKIGYHIFKNEGERKSLGTRKVAQILIAFPPNAGTDEKALAARKADSIYNLLNKGESFEELAKNASNDLSSSFNGGELPEFTTGTYSPEFESVAFGLKRVGELSKPFQTSYGYHILKLLEEKPVANDLNDVTTLGNLQEKVTKDNRMEKAKTDLIDKKLKLIKYKPAPVKEKDLFIFTDSALVNKQPKSLNGIDANTVIFSFAKQTVKAGDWVSYIKITPNASSAASNYQQLYKQYVRSVANEYYRNHLEDYNTNYLNQVQEFREANLLFGIMEKSVWSKANSDTLGLMEYYNQHKSKYLWPASADAIIITCKNEQLADQVQQKLRANFNNWRSFTGSNGDDVVADSGRYELGQLPVVERTNFTPNLITAPVKNETDGTYTFNYIVKVYHEPGQRAFDDAKGMVISDYQQVVEDRWINELKKKYPVTVNQAVFNTIK